MNSRIIHRFALLAIFACAFLLALPHQAFAGTVHGTVHNGTTGKLAGGVEVILIELQGGMQPVQSVKTDAQGAFSFTHPSLGQRPMLLRAVFNGVNFHQPVPPGRDSVDITIFDSTPDLRSVSMPSHIVIFQPASGTLNVGEEYSVTNQTQPPKAFFRADGNFEFTIPDGAELQQVAAWGPSGMPVVQAPIDHGKGKYAIAYAFHPGESGVRLSYSLPYPKDAAVVRLPANQPGSRLVLVAAPTVRLTSEGLQPAGQEQGMNIYQLPPSAGAAPLSVTVSGTAPPPSENAGSSGAGPEASGGAEAASGENIQVVPGRLDALKWPLIGGFAALFLLGALILARKPVAVAVAPDGASAPVPSAPVKLAAAAAIDAEVGASLDALKDRIFKLELRRQAGTISEAEYAEERARAEKILRELVKG